MHCTKQSTRDLGKRLWRQPHPSEILPAPNFRDSTVPRGLIPLGSTRDNRVRSVQADLPMAHHPKTERLPRLLISERPVVRSFVLYLIPYTSSVDEGMLIGSALCKDHLFLYQNENSIVLAPALLPGATWAVVRSQGTPNQHRWYLFIVKHNFCLQADPVKKAFV